MIEIRKYNNQPALAEAVYAVMESVYQPPPWSLEQLASDMAAEDRCYYLAYEGQELVGFLAVQIVGEEMEILQLAVKKEYQGRGIARQLLAGIKEWSGAIFLEVRASNTIAQALYRRQHFHEIGKRKDYYRNPCEDAVVMKRSQDER